VSLRRLVLTLIVCALVGSASSPASATADEPLVVRVVVPERSLQFMNVWIAEGAGYFTAEGLDVQVSVALDQALTGAVLLNGEADVALLPPPMYLQLIERGEPIRLFANLLRNDPINLVVRRDVAEARGLSPEAPLDERLRGLRGLRLGVAPGPPTRLRALFASVGLTAEQEVDVVIVPGEEQTAAFAEQRVDALYTHTPYLEQVLVQQNAVLLVDQSHGDIAAVANPQIHALVTTQTYVDEHADAVAALTRAIYRAQRLAHADLQLTVDALLNSSVPALDRADVQRLLEIYQAAVPERPDVSEEGTLLALRAFPASGRTPDLSGVDLARYIAPEFARDAVAAIDCAC
jgi:NitT/TauT family transport system substrate-binding protein